MNSEKWNGMGRNQTLRAKEKLKPEPDLLDHEIPNAETPNRPGEIGCAWFLRIGMG